MLTSVALTAALLAASPGSGEPAAATPEVRTATIAGLDAAIDKHRGQLVLVNFWATWCKPCVEELPYLIDFANDHKDKGVVVLGFSADDIDLADTKVSAFVEKHQIPYAIYVIDMQGDPNAVIEHFGDFFNGTLPSTVLFDRSGKPVKTHKGEISREELDALLKGV